MINQIIIKRKLSTILSKIKHLCIYNQKLKILFKQKIKWTKLY